MFANSYTVILLLSNYLMIRCFRLVKSHKDYILGGKKLFVLTIKFQQQKSNAMLSSLFLCL
jgi:hypothetical protein